MKIPNCDCMRKALNQFCEIDGITDLVAVYYLSKCSDKGYEEKSVFLRSNACPQCAQEYSDEDAGETE